MQALDVYDEAGGHVGYSCYSMVKKKKKCKILTLGK